MGSPKYSGRKIYNQKRQGDSWHNDCKGGSLLCNVRQIAKVFESGWGLVTTQTKR